MKKEKQKYKTKKTKKMKKMKINSKRLMSNN